jgi:hypothetical protein
MGMALAPRIKQSYHERMQNSDMSYNTRSTNSTKMGITNSPSREPKALELAMA